MFLDILNSLLLSFIPLFVAIDAIGAVPIFISLTESLTPKEKHKILRESIFVATSFAIAFLISGRAIFGFLGITENDFRVAGGLVLLIFAVNDLLFSGETKRPATTSVGIVPLGIPLIIGPAALTTILIIHDNYGLFYAIISIVLNLLVVWVTFRFSDFILKVLGTGGSRAVAKIAALFMAAIAVMMIRVGLTNVIAGM